MALNPAQDDDGVGLGDAVVWRWQDQLEATSARFAGTPVVNLHDYEGSRQG